MGITNIEVPANSSSNTFSTYTDGSGSVGRTDYSNANMWNEVSGPVAICNAANNTARNDAARANVASRAAVRDANANTDDSAGRGNNIDTVAAAVSAAMSASQARAAASSAARAADRDAAARAAAARELLLVRMLLVRMLLVRLLLVRLPAAGTGTGTVLVLVSTPSGLPS
jgi:pyruvate/2-oxoglutarate dehydrogenase complex dihydrolipoamide acyltransferase (E2) component